MNNKEKYRIEFHSINDLSIDWYVEKIEKYTLETKQHISINDFFEIYNIKLYFDNNIYPQSWDDDKKVQYSKKFQDIYKILKEKIFIKNCNNNDFQTIFSELDLIYHDNFWKLFNNYSVYKNISKDVFKNFLENKPQQISTVISYKSIVKFFNIPIKEFLMEYENAAQIIIDYEEHKKIFIPKSLTNDEKEKIIKKYLSQNTTQVFTYSRFIKNFKNTSSLVLSDKTRLLAKKKYEELNKSLLAENPGICINQSIRIDKDQNEPIKEKYNELTFEVSIGEQYLKNLKEDIDLFELFENYFMDNGLIRLIAKKNDEGFFAFLLSKSKTEYAPNNHTFNLNERMALLIIQTISEYLSNEGASIEEYIDSFVKYLNKHIQPNELTFTSPSKNTSDLEKTRHLISEFEALLKQYSLLTMEGEIDYDLIHISTNSTPFGQIKSRKVKKYVYLTSNDFEVNKNIFFSKQEWLLPDRKRNDNLYKSLTNENITLNDFIKYKRPYIEKLIEDKDLRIDSFGNIRINKPYIMHVLFELYNDNVINYSYCDLYLREEIDKLIQEEKLMVDNKLFTKDEVSYLNFFMNEKEFTDGYKLHNKYVHGANSFAQEEHEQDYLRILNMLILVLLKIEDDILNN